MSTLSKTLSFVVIIVAGGLMALAHPFRWDDFVIDSSWLTFFVASVGLCALLKVSTQSTSPLTRFTQAFAAGLMYFTICHYWLVSALTEFGGLPLWIAVLGSGYVAAHCSAFIGVWACVCGSQFFREKSPVVRIWAWASLWVGLEAIRQWLTVSFHWGELGHHFHHSPLFHHSANLWGAHGLTFLWVFVAASVVSFKDIIKQTQEIRSWSISLALLSLVVLVGNFQARSLNPTGEIKVGLIQPNVSQELKWDPDQVIQNIQTLLTLSSETAQESPDLIVWPETAYPRLVSTTQRKLPLSSEIPLLVGAVTLDGRNNRNSALLVQGDQILGRFDKEILVPFGEYVPLKDVLPFGKLVQNAGDFLRGADQDLLTIPNSVLKLGPLICYEDTFNRASVDRVQKGAHLLVNMTNDAWYGRSSALAQHTAIAAFQVYQTLTPMVRSTNNGVSSMITPFERIDLEPFTQTAATMKVPLYSGSSSFYVWTYPLMEWIWWLIFVIASVWKKDRRTKRIFFRN